MQQQRFWRARWLRAGGAVNLENSAGDVASKVASEKEKSVGNVFGFADAAERDSLDERFNHLRGEGGNHVSLRDAGSNSIDADVRGG